VSDHAYVGRVVRVRLLPVAEQVVDDRKQPFLRRVPGLEQVVVETDVVDRLDGDVRVGVRGEQQVLRTGCMGPGPLEHLDARHLRHSLVGGDQGHRVAAQSEFGLGERAPTSCSIASEPSIDAGV